LSNTNPPIALHIPPQGYNELEQLATHATKLQDVVDVSASQRLSATPSDVGAAIASRIGVEPDIAITLLSGLASLHAMTRNGEVTVDALLKAVTQELMVGEAEEEWRVKNIKPWSAAVPFIANALNSITPDHNLILRQKALELTYAHQNIFRRCRIMTDLRPVFDTDGEVIRAMVLTHVLGIEYYDGVRRQRIEFALDEEDVENLRKSAERAKKKTDAARNEFQQSKWPLLIAGDKSSSQ
jgi:hypothetical protein